MTPPIEGGVAEVIHACPPNGSGVMPCCGCTPFEVCSLDRITRDPALVTCRAGHHPTEVKP